MVKTLLIDNYDSFTFNLYQLIAVVNGIPPIVVTNDAMSWEDLLKKHQFDNVVISPGPGSPDKPQDFGICADAIIKAKCPVFGVCLGHQGIAHYFGGKVEHSPSGPMHGRIRKVFHDGDYLFAGIPSPFNVVRYHSLLATQLPEGFIETARTADNLCMGLRHTTRPIYGVQFHPESISTEYGHELLANFARLTEEFVEHHEGTNGKLVIPITSKPSPRRRPAGNLQVTARKLDFFVDPEVAFVSLYGSTPNAFWLDSSRHEPGLARFSYMGDASGPNAHVLRYWTKENKLSIRGEGTETVTKENVLDYLERDLEANRTASDPNMPFEFTGGYVGYFGYELLSAARPGHHVSDLPDAIFVHADQMIVMDHEKQELWLCCCTPIDEVVHAEEWMDQMEARLRTLPATLEPPALPTVPDPIRLSLRHQPAAYLAMIDRCMSYLRDGETYELCLTNMLSAHTKVDPLRFYRTLRKSNPAPYSGFFNFAEAAIVSSSPECYLKIDRKRVVESKPIKGTARRKADPDEDRRVREELENDEKTQAENLMIVDLLRNDLGRVCEVGSVHVPKLMKIESYATVHQMVSTIAGTLRSDCSVSDCIKASFPGGSMTGAPKVRTMELLEGLEKGPRGIYSGAIGFLGRCGLTRLNIVIRTAVVRKNLVTVGTGGAIVALSDPQQELEETFVKLEPVVKALAVATGNKPDDVLDMLWQRNAHQKLATK